MQFFSSDKRLQEIFFQNHPPPPQELNGRPLSNIHYFCVRANLNSLRTADISPVVASLSLIFSSIWILLVLISSISATIPEINFRRRVVLRKKGGSTQATSSFQFRSVNISTAHDLTRGLASSSLILRSKLWLTKKLLRHGNRFAAGVRRRYFLEG